MNHWLHHLLGNHGAHMAHGNPQRRKQMTDFERGQVIGMRKSGESYRKIAKEMNRSFGGIRKICIEYDETASVLRKPGTGSKNKKTTKQQDDAIRDAVTRDRFISTPDIKRKLKLTVSTRTIQRRITYNGFSNYWAVKKPFISETNRQRRVIWAKEHVKWPLSKWKRVLFSDESPYVLRCQRRRRVWRLRPGVYKDQ